MAELRVDYAMGTPVNGRFAVRVSIPRVQGARPLFCRVQCGAEPSGGRGPRAVPGYSATHSLGLPGPLAIETVNVPPVPVVVGVTVIVIGFAFWTVIGALVARTAYVLFA